jgi:hypothetical protein
LLSLLSRFQKHIFSCLIFRPFTKSSPIEKNRKYNETRNETPYLALTDFCNISPVYHLSACACLCVSAHRQGHARQALTGKYILRAKALLSLLAGSSLKAGVNNCHRGELLQIFKGMLGEVCPES